MSAAQAASRAKARRGVTQPIENNKVSFASKTETKQELTQSQLIMRHDYKLFLIEQKLKELNDLMGKNINKEEGLNTINENMLSEALQSMDQRMDNLETLIQEMETTRNNTEVNLKVNKLENEQKELKTLLLKIQGTVMETQMQMMQLRGTTKTVNPITTPEINSAVAIEDSEVTTEDGGKKRGKNK